MLSPESVRELRSHWLPNVTDAGLDRLIEILTKDSPLLVHGCFTPRRAHGMSGDADRLASPRDRALDCRSRHSVGCTG